MTFHVHSDSPSLQLTRPASNSKFESQIRNSSLKFAIRVSNSKFEPQIRNSNLKFEIRVSNSKFESQIRNSNLKCHLGFESQVSSSSRQHSRVLSRRSRFHSLFKFAPFTFAPVHIPIAHLFKLRQRHFIIDACESSLHSSDHPRVESAFQ